MCRVSYVFVNSVHFGFDGFGQCGEVILGGHVGGVDRVEDGQSCFAGEEDGRAGFGDAVGALDDDGEDREAGVYGDAERALVEWQQLGARTAGSLGEDDQRVAAFAREPDALVDGPSG